MDGRLLKMHMLLRYARVSAELPEFEGYPNFRHVMSAPGSTLPMLTLERGITTPAEVEGPDHLRRPAILIRSSPWKAGHETNPWHDEFDVDNGRARYFGDRKVTSPQDAESTPGNRALLDAWKYHSSTNAADRMLAPPLILFRAQTVRNNGQTFQKGYVEFLGAALITGYQRVMQRDPQSDVDFANLVFDLTVVDLSAGDDFLDVRWINDRRDAGLDADTANRHAPESWARWIAEGGSAIPSIRRRAGISARRRTDGRRPQPGAATVRLVDDQGTVTDVECSVTPDKDGFTLVVESTPDPADTDNPRKAPYRATRELVLRRLRSVEATVEPIEPADAAVPPTYRFPARFRIAVPGYRSVDSERLAAYLAVGLPPQVNETDEDRAAEADLLAALGVTDEIVDAEAVHVTSTSYERKPGTVLVRRAEAVLVARYRQSIGVAGDERLNTAVGFTDLYVRDRGEIIEAKRSAHHGYVRDALAQLLDYAVNTTAPVHRLTALFPSRPAEYDIALLHAYGVDCLFWAGGAQFTAVPAATDVRDRMVPRWAITLSR